MLKITIGLIVVAIVGFAYWIYKDDKEWSEGQRQAGYGPEDLRTV